MIKNYISINLGLKKKQIFLIWYPKDGWFFVQDLLRISDTDKRNYWVHKLTYELFKSTRTTPTYSAVTNGVVKLSHHVDWNAQISWTGVMSWYDESGKPKWAAIKSCALNDWNDGWPIFTFVTWGVENYRDAACTDIFLSAPKFKWDSSKRPWYAIFWYYLPKYRYPNIENMAEILYGPPNTDPIKLKILPWPQDAPWVLWVSMKSWGVSFNSDYGFALNGAPSTKYSWNYCDNILVFYPHQHSYDNIQDLNFYPK